MGSIALSPFVAVIGDPSVDRVLHSRRPEASSYRLEDAEGTASLKSIAPIRCINSDRNRHRSNEAYWMLGNLGPDMQDPERLAKV